MNNPFVELPNFKPFTCLPCFSFWIAAILYSVYCFDSIFDLNHLTIAFSSYAVGLIFFKLKL